MSIQQNLETILRHHLAPCDMRTFHKIPKIAYELATEIEAGINQGMDRLIREIVAERSA